MYHPHGPAHNGPGPITMDQLYAAHRRDGINNDGPDSRIITQGLVPPGQDTKVCTACRTPHAGLLITDGGH